MGTKGQTGERKRGGGRERGCERGDREGRVIERGEWFEEKGVR